MQRIQQGYQEPSVVIDQMFSEISQDIYRLNKLRIYDRENEVTQTTKRLLVEIEDDENLMRSKTIKSFAEYIKKLLELQDKHDELLYGDGNIGGLMSSQFGNREFVGKLAILQEAMLQALDEIAGVRDRYSRTRRELKDIELPVYDATEPDEEGMSAADKQAYVEQMKQEEGLKKDLEEQREEVEQINDEAESMTGTKSQKKRNLPTI